MSTKKAVLIGAAIVLGGLSLACGAGSTTGTTHGPGVTSTDPTGAASAKTGAASTGAAAVKSGHTIVFEVTGNGVTKASTISYGVGGNQSQDNGAALPWQKQSTSDDPFLILSLVAQSGGGSGSISCKITVDGKVVVDNTSQGQYAVVTCSGTA
jgi:hypothetical protein